MAPRHPRVQLEDELMGKERLQAEEKDIREMESKGMAKKDVSLKDVISLWVTNIILTYGDPEKYASLQDGAVKSEGVVDDLVSTPPLLPCARTYIYNMYIYIICTYI